MESLLDFQLMDDYEKTESWIEELNNQLKRIKSNSNIICVNYKDLNELSTCKELWEYLIPNSSFNEKRWHFLDELYVNILIGKSYQRMIPESLFSKFSKRKNL